MLIEKYTLNEERNVTLTCYLQPITGENWGMTKRPAMIVIPGGGYSYCSEREADPIAYPYLMSGYHVFILRYSLCENATWPNPLNDYDSAVDLIKDKADEWALDSSRIAVVGFSAGGHLAACCATVAKNKPAAALLGYPCIDKETTEFYSHTDMPDASSLVDNDTCPCFIFASSNDGVVPIRNSLKFMTALAEHNVMFECHIYPFANHGFSTCDTSINSHAWCCSRTADWVNDSREFLRDVVGDFTDGVLGLRKYW